MNGRKLYVMPEITAIGVASSRNSGGTPGMRWIADTMGDVSARRIFQEIVRSRKLVKNGATTRNRSRFLYRPPLNAIV